MHMVVFRIPMKDDKVRIAAIAHFMQPFFSHFGKLLFVKFPSLAGNYDMELLVFYPVVAIGVDFQKGFHFIRRHFRGRLQVTEIPEFHQLPLGRLGLVGVVGHPIEGTGR